MSELKIILSEKCNISKNIYLNKITTCQIGLIQGHLNPSHIFESKKITLNVLPLFRSFTNSNMLLTQLLQLVQLIFLQQCIKQHRKKVLNKSNVSFSFPNSSHYMFLIFPKRNSSLLSLTPSLQKPVTSLRPFLLGRRDHQTCAIID